MTARPEFGAAIEDLRKLIAKATQEDLSDDGRYFYESCSDLTQCRHSEIGEYQNRHDGKLVEWLWNRRNEILSLYTSTALPLAHPAAPQGEEGVEAAFKAWQALACNEPVDLREAFTCGWNEALMAVIASNERNRLAALAPAAIASGREGAE